MFFTSYIYVHRHSSSYRLSVTKICTLSYSLKYNYTGPFLKSHYVNNVSVYFLVLFSVWDFGVLPK